MLFIQLFSYELGRQETAGPFVCQTEFSNYTSLSLKRSTRYLKICAWEDNSSLAAALSSAVAEFVWTTSEITSMLSVI